MIWCKPKLVDMQTELQSASLDLGVPLDILHLAMEGGRLVPLERYHWCLLQNSDSNETFSLAEAEAVAARYGQDIGPVCRRIASRLGVPAPVILFRSELRPWLVAGNIPLMVCRALNVRPEIWRIELPSSDGSSSQPI
jgi:hypothetical protein